MLRDRDTYLSTNGPGFTESPSLSCQHAGLFGSEAGRGRAPAVKVPPIRRGTLKPEAIGTRYLMPDE